MELHGYDAWKLASPDEDDESPEVEEIPDAPEPDEDWLNDGPVVEDEENLWGV